MGDGERVGVKAFVPWTLSPCQSITHDFLFSLALPSKLWTNWSSVFSQHISRRRSHFLASHNWSEMLQQYKRQIDGKKWSRKSTLENPARERKKSFLRESDSFFRCLASLLSFIRCSCGAFDFVLTLCVPFLCVIVQDSLSSHERVASLKLFQLSKLNCLLWNRFKWK